MAKRKRIATSVGEQMDEDPDVGSIQLSLNSILKSGHFVRSKSVDDGNRIFGLIFSAVQNQHSLR